MGVLEQQPRRGEDAGAANCTFGVGTARARRYSNCRKLNRYAQAFATAPRGVTLGLASAIRHRSWSSCAVRKVARRVYSPRVTCGVWVLESSGIGVHTCMSMPI